MSKKLNGRIAESAAQRCCETVPTSGLRMHYHQCQRLGKFEHNGKVYCRQHYPPHVEQRKQDRSASWESDWRAKGQRAERDAKIAHLHAELEAIAISVKDSGEVDDWKWQQIIMAGKQLADLRGGSEGER